jgi:uncharacterized protein (TIGR02147 family)
MIKGEIGHHGNWLDTSCPSIPALFLEKTHKRTPDFAYSMKTKNLTRKGQKVNTSEPQTKSLFNYFDYREYLADFFATKKAENPSYSHRLFARSAGLSSPSYLLMVIDGKRNLTSKTISKFAGGLKLSAPEKKYFERLVHYNQSQEMDERADHFAALVSLKAPVKALRDLERTKFDFLSNWFVVAVYVLIDLKDFKADPAWIAKRLGGKITAEQAKEALSILSKLNMIEPDEARGYKQTQGAITTADDTRSIAVYRYHQSMIRLAAEALKNQSLIEREMNGATIAIPKSKLPEIKERIRAFRKEINQLASSYQNPDEVYQLNIQLFALTEKVKP